MRVLVTTVHPTVPGGVSGFYRSMQDKFSSDVRYFTVGWRVGERTKANRFLGDIVKFAYLNITQRFDLVLFNPSLDFNAVFRDGLNLVIAKLCGRTVIVFFHGWSKSFENRLRGVRGGLFRFIFSRADAILVLASEFEKVLRRRGFRGRIYQITTAVDDDLHSNIDEALLLSKNSARDFVLLFLSRIQRDKGIYETMAAFTLLKTKYSHLRLLIAGDGSELNNVKQYIVSNKLIDVEVLGNVSDLEKKRDVFLRSNVYILPTSHDEGLPVAMLEAMSFGLPVITRPVGGIRDVVVHEKMGYLTESKDPKLFAEYIEKLMLNESLRDDISRYNFEFARTHFMASRVAERMEKIFADTIGRSAKDE